MRLGRRQWSGGQQLTSYLRGNVSVVGDVTAADHVATPLHAIAGHSIADNPLNALARICIGIVPATLLAGRLVTDCHAQRLTEIYATCPSIVRWLNKVLAIAFAILQAITAIKFCVGRLIKSAE